MRPTGQDGLLSQARVTSSEVGRGSPLILFGVGNCISIRTRYSLALVGFSHCGKEWNESSVVWNGMEWGWNGMERNGLEWSGMSE